MPTWISRDILLLPLTELFTVTGFLLALVLLSQVARSNRPPQSTIAWLLTIVFLPYVGVPLYLMLGGRKMQRMARRKAGVYEVADVHSGSDFGTGLDRVLRTYGVPQATDGNRVELVTSGVDAYRRLCALIDGAAHSIHLTSYILGRDAVGEAVVARLARRAAEGVRVRVLLDDIGSWRIRKSFYAAIEEAGGKVAFFMPVLHWPFHGRSNLRNHRKIIVADGRAALTGGMNIAGEYMGPTPDPARWRDVSLVIEGPAAIDLERLFWSDWTFTTGEARPADEGEALAAFHPDDLPGNTKAQVVASGPDVEGDPLYEAFITLLFSARERVWVVTPYFVPDEILVRALDLAARRGVDVRIVVPNRSNHLSADLARVGYLRQVDEAGGRVLRYKPAMVHAKVVLIDRDLTVVGSANMDMRSLFLNYEVAVFLHSEDKAAEVEQWLLGLMSQSRPGLSRQNWARGMAENVVRLISPLL